MGIGGKYMPNLSSDSLTPLRVFPSRATFAKKVGSSIFVVFEGSGSSNSYRAACCEITDN